MGGVILAGLVIVAVLLLLSPAMRARGLRRREEVEAAAAEAVLKRLEDGRPPSAGSKDEPPVSP
jgi:hypothetical protein